jgi:tight adherence protein B
MRPKVATTALLGLCVLAWAAPATGQPRLDLTPAGGAAFPSRSFVLTLPDGVLADRDAVRVRENGRIVSDLAAIPAGESGKSAIVLVIDASDSMRGRPIRSAVDAAKAFAAESDPEQQLGVLAFNRRITTLAPLESGPDAVAATLAKPPRLHSGTHLYDAVDEGVSMLKAAGATSGSVVVLSDGADTDSRTGVEQLAPRARAAGVRVFTVGLRSTAFNAAALRALAAGANGEYSEAGSPTDLAAIYRQLGSRLSQEFLVTYRSSTRPGTRVTVAALVDGVPGVATSRYVAGVPGKGEESATGVAGFWGSTIVMVGFALLAAALLAAACVMLLLAPGRQSLRTRMGGFVSLPEGVDAGTWGSALARSVVATAERTLERTGRWAALEEELDIARIPLSGAELAVLTTVGTTVAGVMLFALSGTLLVAALALFIPVTVNVVVGRRARRQRRLFGEQLADNLQVLASAMRAGHSFIGALSVAAGDAAEPARTELARVISDEQVGVPLEETLRTTMRRMQNDDLEQVVLVAVLQRDTGGNTAEVIDGVAATIRERSELRRMIDTLTAQGRLSRWVVSSLPVILVVLMTVINPDYMQPLFDTGLGKAMLAISAVLVVAGSLTIKRIVSIKV